MKNDVASACEQTKLDALNATVAALLRAGVDPTRVPTVMQPDIGRVEQDTGRKLVFADAGTDGPRFSYARRRGRRYARSRKPNEVRFLSGMIDGVWIVVNLHKPRVYSHDSMHVADALRTLADAIDRTEARLAEEDADLEFDIQR